MTDIGFAGLAITGLLVLVAIGLSLWRQLGLEGTIAWAAVRAAAQLLAVGGILTVLLDPDVSILWSWLWVVAMIVFAAFTVRRRAPEVPRLFTLALAAFGAASFVTLGVLFGLGVFELDARTLIPLAGLMIGNSMTATVLVARSALRRAARQARRGRGPARPRPTRSRGRAPVRPQRAPDRAHAADRDDEGRRPGVPAWRDDGPHPGRGGSGGRGARADRGDVRRARVGGDHHDRGRPRRAAPTLHPGPPDAPHPGARPGIEHVLRCPSCGTCRRT